jgi:nucleotide-binding universal stress UspA family protein
MKNAILGTDLSAASEKIIDNAIEFRLLGVRKIVLVHILNLRSTDDFSEYDIESAQAKMESQKKRLMGMGFESDAKIVMGVPAMELMRQAKNQEAGLVIIGSRGSTWSKSTLGATASELLHNIKCPVLLMAFCHEPDPQEQEESHQEEIHHFEKFVRQFRQKEPRIELLNKIVNQHVLLTTDFSDFSENSFEWLKNHMTSVPRLTLLHIQDAVRIKHLENRLEEFNQIDTARLERLRKEFRQVHPETVISNVLLYGNPKQLIPQYIKENQVTLAVMGSQGRGYISEFFLGSVSLRVARVTPSNLLIIPFNTKL